MRFSALLVSGALAVAAAQNTVSVSPAQAAVTACLKNCQAGDVNCQAHCVGVPNPDDSQVNANTKCAAECPQGDGSPAQTEKFAACLAKCSNQHYFTSGGTPQPTGGAGGSGSGGSGNGGAGGAGGSGTGGAGGAGGAGATQTGGAGGAGGSGSGATGGAGGSGSGATGGAGGNGAAATTDGTGSSPTTTASPTGSGNGGSGGTGGSGNGATGGSGSGTSTSKALAPAVTAAPVAILGLVAAVLAL